MTPFPRLAPLLLTGTLLLVGGCSIIGGPKQPSTLYAPEPRIQPDPAWPAASWSLSLAHNSEPRMMDSGRIVVSPVAGELQVYRGAGWVRAPGLMVEDAVLQTLEDSGKLPAVARQGSGIAADYRLWLEVRQFKADYAGGTLPTAVIEVNAKLLHLQDATIIGNRTFRQEQPAATAEVPQVADAFALALGAIGRDLAGWTLQTGQAHETLPHR